MQNLILLHGALCFQDDLEQLSAALKQKGIRTHRFSFSGHGKSPVLSEFGIAQFGRELEDFIITNHLEQSAVFGYSMGGYVALCLALRRKDLIARIITLGTKFNWSEESVAKETKQLNPELILQKVPAFAKTLEQKHGERWKDLMGDTAAMMRQIGDDHTLNETSLKEITLPVCIGLADKDQMVSLEETVNVYKQLPSGSMYMLPGSKHPLETANLEVLSEVIRSFLEKG